jgi:hypothetical protein
MTLCKHSKIKPSGCGEAALVRGDCESSFLSFPGRELHDAPVRTFGLAATCPRRPLPRPVLLSKAAAFSSITSSSAQLLQLGLFHYQTGQPARDRDVH